MSRRHLVVRAGEAGLVPATSSRQAGRSPKPTPIQLVRRFASRSRSAIARDPVARGQVPRRTVRQKALATARFATPRVLVIGIPRSPSRLHIAPGFDEPDNAITERQAAPRRDPADARHLGTGVHPGGVGARTLQLYSYRCNEEGANELASCGYVTLSALAQNARCPDRGFRAGRAEITGAAGLRNQSFTRHGPVRPCSMALLEGRSVRSVRGAAWPVAFVEKAATDSRARPWPAGSR